MPAGSAVSGHGEVKPQGNPVRGTDAYSKQLNNDHSPFIGGGPAGRGKPTADDKRVASYSKIMAKEASKSVTGGGD